MRRLRRNDEGAAAVEFALILVPLILVIMVTIGLGWGLARYVSVTGAAREGARAMSVGRTFSEARDLAIASAPLVCASSGAGCSIPTVPACTPGNQVTFSVSMNELVPMALPLLPAATGPFEARAVMRCE